MQNKLVIISFPHLPMRLLIDILTSYVLRLYVIHISRWLCFALVWLNEPTRIAYGIFLSCLFLSLVHWMNRFSLFSMSFWLLSMFNRTSVRKKKELVPNKKHGFLVFGALLCVLTHRLRCSNSINTKNGTSINTSLDHWTEELFETKFFHSIFLCFRCFNHCLYHCLFRPALHQFVVGGFRFLLHIIIHSRVVFSSAGNTFQFLIYTRHDGRDRGKKEKKTVTRTMINTNHI